jgi:TolB-like protein/predicted Zn-dependent protease
MQLGSVLGTAFVLKGSVRRADSQLRITVKLIELDSRSQLWADRFDRNTEDVFAIQDEIAARVVDELSRKFAGLKRIPTVRAHTPDIVAYDLYVRGRAKRIPPTAENLASSLALFDKAREIDPSFAGGFAGAAVVHILLYSDSTEQAAKPEEHLREARRLAERAVKLDPAFGPAWGALAEARFRQGNFEAALNAAKKAIETAPADSLMRANYGRYLAQAGRANEAVEEIKAAMRMSPDSLPMLYFLGGAYRMTGDYDRAIEALVEHRKRLAGRILPAPTTQLIAAYVQSGRVEDARLEAAALLQAVPGYAAEIAARNHVFLRNKDRNIFLGALKSAGLPDRVRPNETSKPAIAVLPFANLSNDKEQEYFADGMTDDLITDLSKVSGLIVIARNSVFTYKGRNVKVQDVATDLNVTHVLEGSVRRAGNKLRINAQLIDAKTGDHLWAERYDREMKGVFALQDELTGAIANALKITMNVGEKKKVVRRPTDNPKAYEAFLEGRKVHRELEQFYIWKAFAAYEKATKLDPKYAEAYAEDASLAATVYFMGFGTIFDALQARRRYEKSIEKAFALEPDNATALRARAFMLLLDGLKNEALLTAQQIVSSNPNDAAAKITLAEILVAAGKVEEGRQAMDAALRIEPEPDLLGLVVAGRVYFAAGQYEKSATFFQKLARKAPKSFDGHHGLVVTNVKLGRMKPARESLDRFLKLWAATNVTYLSVLLRHWGERLTEPWIEALREAGLPQWPHGFEAGHEIRLTGEEIRRRLFNHTMASQFSLASNKQWRIETNGTWQGSNGLYSFSGTARVMDDFLCLTDFKSLMGREYCVPVFRDPNGTAAERNEYLYPGVEHVHRFSVIE